MKLECTKKLLEYLGVKPDKAIPAENTDPLFAWTANLITINRRKTLVAVNVASRCMFLLYGLTVKDIRSLPALLLEGVRSMLQSEYVKPEIIEAYLNDCGRTVTYAANSSRSVVAISRGASERVAFFSDLFAQDDRFQRALLRALNNNVHPKENYADCYSVLIERLKEQYGEDVCSCRSAELEVELELGVPCRRTLVVPEDLNFYQLHMILQRAFEWQDCHLHRFVLEKDAYGRPTKIIELADEAWDEFVEVLPIVRLDSLETDIGAVLQTYGKIQYEYDFGDGWTHTVTLKRRIDDCTAPYPHCTEAIGDAPMEDCGGPGGFAEVMDIMRNPDHPEHREVCEWVRGTWWQPLDLGRINRRICNSHRMSIPVYYE